ncbi:hypothetical protein DL1_03195 [Thioclava dalianensis]|uniref:Uncharacterized protein n=1 Tax=Thioclava dalianensis TaxID=1185766 RepID=A0A074U4P0_9RHOB|nr:hypothetical protein [Thioclava dalianensis]KEP69617.1 hypothetical protein DL1_03195 [Thioclava dalianensis]SFN15792.1 hypothetical protein SAMN05216224_102702 [Thioclava dalianensis]
MPDFRKITRANMKSLVDWFGCYDAVAETFNARWGGGSSKGTVSKKVSGTLDWTVADVVALEDAAGRYPVTRMLARRLEDRPAVDAGSLLMDGSSIAKESGEAIAAILAAEQSSGADEKAQAIKEIDDALFALGQARVRLEGLSGAGW